MAMFSCSLYVGTMIEYFTVSPPPFGFLVVVLVMFLSFVSLSPACEKQFFFPAKILKRQKSFEFLRRLRDEKIHQRSSLGLSFVRPSPKTRALRTRENQNDHLSSTHCVLFIFFCPHENDDDENDDDDDENADVFSFFEQNFCGSQSSSSFKSIHLSVEKNEERRFENQRFDARLR